MCEQPLAPPPSERSHAVRLRPQTENWYQLSGITPIGEWGSLRLRLRYSHDLAMPCEEYSSLKELLLDGQLEAVRALAGLRHVDRVPLAAALLKVFRSVAAGGTSSQSDLL